MSKVNRRKEIKEKEELQARFQVSLAQNNAKVMSWLQPKKETAATRETDVENSFLNLPIVPSGVGLSSIESSSSKIGDFINSTASNMNELKPERPGAPSSKPMIALLNKMRDSERNKIHNSRVNKPHGRTNPSRPAPGTVNRPPVQKQTINRPAEPDSDSDEESAAMKSRSVKKPAPTFKGKKGRPF